MIQHQKHLWPAEVQFSKRENYSLKRKKEKTKQNKQKCEYKEVKCILQLNAVCDLRIESS